jgi:hypothetical protein
VYVHVLWKREVLDLPLPINYAIQARNSRAADLWSTMNTSANSSLAYFRIRFGTNGMRTIDRYTSEYKFGNVDILQVNDV